MPSIADLEALTKQFPAKAFPRYGLAMEYKKAARYEDAIREFQHAMRLDPNYVAAWHHAGQSYVAWGKPEDAKRVYLEGIEVAKRIGNGHALSELTAELQALG